MFRLVARGVVPLVLMALAIVAVPFVGDSGVAAQSTEKHFDKTVQRVFEDGGDRRVVDSRDVKVSIDKTENLRGRERVHIQWSGAHPTGARAVNPYGAGDANGSALKQEYPMLIMQCRGTAKTLTPQTCWTSTRMQRSTTEVWDRDEAIWRDDPFATDADRNTFSGVDPAVAKQKCPGLNLPVDGLDGPSSHITPFDAANKKVYLACDSDTMPPEAAVDSSFPAAEMAAFTTTKGTGDVYFEVRSDVENDSLGCSDKVACSIVMIPIMGLSCGTSYPGCRDTGRNEPGSTFESSVGYDQAVSPRFWWSPSNWNNRITIPITFGPPPNVCDLLDSRAPVGFYGSELMAQAGLQWAPAYCLNKSRFKFQANKMPDDAAFDLLSNGDAAAAFLSRARTYSGTGSVGYAPTAITGFAIGFIIDEPDNGGEVPTIKLTPRLLAKLLTNSYAARLDGRQHPGMADNPIRLNLDPEFQALNPGLTEDYETEAAAALMSLSVSSDTMEALTDYIDRDKEARAFLDGDKDPWGMVVNPSYKGIKLPVGDWPLDDTWLLPSNDACVKANTTPYFTQVAAPVSSMRTIAEALLDSWPLVQTRADGSKDQDGNDVCKYGRIDRQDIGHRFLLGVVNMGDAERLGLRTAELQTSVSDSGKKFTDADGRTFAGPSNKAMSAALAAYRPAASSKPFTFDPAKLTKAAYPGTMVVYTAALLQGMDKTKAKDVAEFVRIATTEGQQQGSKNGELPAGYLPLVKTGATAALWKQAQSVATLIAAQDSGSSDSSSSTDSSKDTASATPTPASKAADAAASGDAKAAAPARMVLTTDPSAVSSSTIAALILPLLILGAAISMLATPVLRMLTYQGDE